MKLPYAHDVDYWKTGSKRSTAQWVALAIEQIRQHGGTNIISAEGEQNGEEAFMLGFELAGDRHKIVWPVLPVRYDADKVAARRQAATTLYHDVKAKCVAATRYGVDFGFFPCRVLPNGQTVSELATPDLMDVVPTLMRPQLEAP